MNADQLADMEDIQGLILRGYNFRYIRYIIFSIADAQGARDFCADLLPGSGKPMCITNAEPWPGGVKPDYCLNIGLTYSGMLQLIGQPDCDTVAGDSPELFSIFQQGATYPNNTAAIGDTGASAPKNWWKNSGGWLLKGDPTPNGSELHLQLTLFTHNPESREAYYHTLLSMIPAAGGGQAVVPAFYMDSDPIAVGEDLDYIHFGYKDSLSQPRIGNTLWNKKEVRLLTGVSTVDDRPVVPLYHFAIATSTPSYNAHKLLENGTFAAFRLLYQDVGAFNSFIASDKTTSPELVAAKMCGRWFDGTPLVVSPGGEDKSLKDFDFTNFNYLTHTPNQLGPPGPDDLGARCPYAAHIRRANPRDDSGVTGNNPPNEVHRVLRRASPYGPPYKSDEPKTPEVKRGLVGLFIGANLTDQFQFIMSQWISNGGFRYPDKSPNSSGIDPLFGPQAGDPDPDNHNFAYNTGNGKYKVIPGLERFIRTDGSLYLFLPGIAGLKSLSEGTIPG
jgi:deferrochelatase/peroxidase EfeB